MRGVPNVVLGAWILIMLVNLVIFNHNEVRKLDSIADLLVTFTSVT